MTKRNGNASVGWPRPGDGANRSPGPWLMGGQGRSAKEILATVELLPVLAVFAIVLMVVGWIRAAWFTP